MFTDAHSHTLVICAFCEDRPASRTARIDDRLVELCVVCLELLERGELDDHDHNEEEES
jgi:hypothetical protein